MIRICVVGAMLLIASSPVFAQGIDGSGEVVTDTTDTVSVTATNQPVLNRHIVRIGRDGHRTETESLTSPLDAASASESLPTVSTLRTIIHNRDAELDLLEIVARATTITETATPDGTTRIIRIISEGGQGATLITITKD
jgi:hypothetical protein